MDADTAAPPPEEKKSWFETVVISTPVLLTVIATFLVGQSSSEMTRAQYFRSVASQNQSKAGDQWGFYQAKRIRGQVLDATADLLIAQKRDQFTRDTLVDSAQNLLKELSAVKEASGDLHALVVEAEKTVAETKATLDRMPKEVQAAIDALQNRVDKKKRAKKSASKDAPEPKSAGASEQEALLKDIVNDIKRRAPEREIAPKVLKITDETLENAIKDADKRADLAYQRGKVIDNVLEELDGLVDQQAALAFEFQQLARKMPALEKQAEVVRGLIAKLHGDYNAARHAFSARRYEDDARSNQEAAYYYEVKVYLNSSRSDKHLFRSKMFLFAMLVAQGGVTIATLAIAVRRKSIFWGLATLTGLIAIGFGAYIYLDLLPISTF